MARSLEEAATFSSTQFDYLIIGGGIGGLTLAARLSEDTNISVGILEAGMYLHDMPQISIPGYSPQNIGNPQVDWMFSTTPQKGLDGRKVPHARGKALGGSTAIHFGFTTRAAAEEYDAFGSLGNPDWNWSEFLKYSKKSETSTAPSEEDAKKYNIHPEEGCHGMGGPIAKSFPIWHSDLDTSYFESLNALGVIHNQDPHNGDNIGSWTASFSIDPKTVTRSYATTAYYEPNATRSNFHILTSAHVTKILTRKDATEVVATGVEFKHEDKVYVASANREVILCAGTFQTPQLLELSGIGNSSILKAHGIETVLDLPSIGENLQDHVFVPIIQEVKPGTQTHEVLADPAILQEQIELYAKEKKGIFSSFHSAAGILPLRVFAEDAAAERIIQSVKSANHGPKHIDLYKKWIDDPKHGQLEVINCPTWLKGAGEQGNSRHKPRSRYQTTIAVLMHPFSRGSVHITSGDPFSHPAIDPGYLNDPVDIELLVEAVKFSRRLAVTPPFSQYHQEYAQPGPEVQSDEDLRKWVIQSAGTSCHPLGTASMLPKDDGGVVDADLLVYGTKNLRVVDASVIPFEPACHIQSMMYAIAEKAADIIKLSQIAR